MTSILSNLPENAVGLRLARICGERLILCEAMRFDDGRKGVELVLRRAQIAGRIDFDSEIKNHFADVLDDGGDIVETVVLDAGSYGAIKNKWMRCKVEHI